MPIDAGELGKLRRFFATHDLAQGCIALDLDGTALTEDQGRIYISSTIEAGVRAIYERQRPIILNTLRFPLSVIHTIGNAWYELADIPIPTVLLNGSILGNIRRTANGQLEHEEIAAYPLNAHELKLVLNGVSELLAKGIDEILLFYYARDWRLGETLWTPKADRVEILRKKFRSAATVKSSSLDDLAAELNATEICMMSLFIDRPQDTLMAYQHSKRNSFFTHKATDKASGLREIARRFDVSLDHSLGAGDTEMDSFLNEVGLAVVVGDRVLPFHGKSDTMRVASPLDLGELLSVVANLSRKPIAV